MTALDRALVWAVRQGWTAEQLLERFEELRGAEQESARVAASQRAAAEEARAMVRLQRAAEGARPTGRRLSRADARRCVEAHARGVTWAVLAERYGVAASSLPSMVRRLTR